MTRPGLAAAMISAGFALVYAQGRGGGGWATTGSDPQRTSWVRTDPRISNETVHESAFQLLWRMKLESQPRQLSSLTQPLLLPNIISYKGFKALAFVGGTADTVYAIDYDLGKMFWKARLGAAPGSPGPATSRDCAGGPTTITRATQSAQTPAAAPGRAGGPGGPPGGGRGGNNTIYAVSSRGTIHALNPQTGEDLSPARTFVPPGANVAGAVLVDTVLYAAAAGCGGTPGGVWAADVSSGTTHVLRWQSNGAEVVGTAGPTVGEDGTIFVATGDGGASSEYQSAVVALDPITLTVKDWFTTGGAAFTSSPVAFKYKDRQLLVAASRDGRLYLLDTGSLGGADHRTPLYKTAPYGRDTPDFTAGALATFEDAERARWVLAPIAGPAQAEKNAPGSNGAVTNGGIAAFTLADHEGALTLQPRWISRDMMSPLPPLVINGVVFAVAGGEHRPGAAVSERERAQRSKPAVLYAFDAATGRQLWSSGSTMTSFAHRAGPSGGDGQVYVATYDGTLYAFGIPLEH